ncbi:MAG TPA: acetate--CoA ligase family protein [Dehalococcoidia bacterium]|nr:acetate--CoA ligase family protein [Dehalococcoidia bacterium]
MSDPVTTQKASRLLTEVEAKELLSSAGIAVAATRLATSAADASKIAEQLGFPVVIKIVSPDIAHKSDIGGVRLNLNSPADVAAAYEAMMADVAKVAPSAKILGAAVQHMEPAGTEVIMGMTKDPQFGPVLMFGLGGIFVEVLQDVAFRIVPLERRDARQMIREIKGYAVLEGVRGQDPSDIEALEDMLLKLSAFVEARPEIAELDLNPVFAYKKGALAVDARIVVEE